MSDVSSNAIVKYIDLKMEPINQRISALESENQRLRSEIEAMKAKPKRLLGGKRG